MNKELEFLEEKHGDNSWGHYPPSKREVAQWLQEWTEKQFVIHGVVKSFYCYEELDEKLPRCDKQCVVCRSTQKHLQ